MCRAGGRRCPGGHSHSKANQAARQRLSRANRTLKAAQATGDPGRIEAAQQKLTKVQSEMEQLKQAYTHETPNQARDVTTPDAPVSVADQIRDTVRAITQEPGRWGTLGWVNLATLRERLPHVDRADLDRVLDDLITDQDVHLMAELNQKVMTDQDRAAAVTIGGEDRHMIQFTSHQDPDPDALERVRRQGAANSGNADLAAALNTRGVGDELYAQIRDEETRRRGHTPPEPPVPQGNATPHPGQRKDGGRSGDPSDQARSAPDSDTHPATQLAQRWDRMRRQAHAADNQKRAGAEHHEPAATSPPNHKTAAPEPAAATNQPPPRPEPDIGFVIHNTNSVSGNARVGSQHDVHYGHDQSPGQKPDPQVRQAVADAVQAATAARHAAEQTRQAGTPGQNTRNVAAGDEHVQQQIGVNVGDTHLNRRRTD